MASRPVFTDGGQLWRLRGVRTAALCLTPLFILTFKDSVTGHFTSILSKTLWGQHYSHYTDGEIKAQFASNDGASTESSLCVSRT